jgi:hypothetical protein
LTDIALPGLALVGLEGFSAIIVLLAVWSGSHYQYLH